MAKSDKTPYLTAILKTSNAGFATLIILILILTLTGTGLEIFIKANAGLRMIRRQAQSQQAVYCAEGGIEWAKAQLLHNPEWRGGSRLVAGNNTRVTVSLGEEGYWVNSAAVSGQARREIKVYLHNSTGEWVMTNYQELHH
ncbi:MAG TPA: hypothetical protein VN374_04805 [Desulfitobacteriaceae bacterium]|nr:hypothetical protein [Desulfitobacteriaceae bacterium]